MSKTITMSIGEYEELLKKIKDKDAYIQKCVVNGEIDIVYMRSVEVFKYLGGLGGFGVYSNASEFDLGVAAPKSKVGHIGCKSITKEQLEEIQSEKDLAIQEYKDGINSMSFIDRLAFLFQGRV